MNPGNILQLGIKELWSLARDRGLLAFILFAFSVAIYGAAKALPETLHNAPIAIVDEDGSPLSQRIADAFGPPQFRLPDRINASVMDARMDAGRDMFAIVIPPGFQRDVLAGRSPAIQLNVDATLISQAFAGSGHVQSIVSGEVRAFLDRDRNSSASPVELAMRTRFNPERNQAWFGSVMKLIDNITILAIVLSGAALLRERERGTVEHLLVMPVTPFEIMTAKIWSMGLVVLIACTLSLFLIIRGVLGVPIEGPIPAFLAGASLHLFAVTSLGIFLATFARSMPQFGLLLILVMLPLQMLSGGFTPRESMPEWVQWLMRIAPTTHFVMLSQAILYRGAGLSVVWPQFMALVVVGIGFFSVALARFRRTMGTAA